MKGTVRSSLLVLLLLSICAPSPSGARTSSGPSANGDFRFEMDDGVTRHLEFDARVHKDGTARGQMTFSAQGELPDQDVDGEGAAGLPAGVFMKAEFDCVTVEGNRAVMGGAVTESNVAGYAGRRVLLVVEDGGEGVKAESPDRLTWGVYLKPAEGPSPSDAERPDESEPTEWMVSDFERPDDPQQPFKKGAAAAVGCQSFPPSSYSFVDVKHGDGNIQVRP